MNPFITAITPLISHGAPTGKDQFIVLSVAVFPGSVMYDHLFHMNYEKEWKSAHNIETIKYASGVYKNGLLIGPEHWGDWTKGTMLEVDGELINVLYSVQSPAVKVRKSKKLVLPLVPME